MSDQAEQVLQILNKAVETDQLKLPTLPEVALKIRQAVEKDSHSAADIAELLQQDGSLSARLLQLANSPLYRARSEIDNLQMAVTRLGVRIVKDLVVMLALKQAFKASDSAIDAQFRKIWQTSIDVAAACRVLAQQQPQLDTEQAMLAGLIHNIGALPIIELASRQKDLFNHGQTLESLCDQLQGILGEKILSFWNFPQSLIEVVSQWNNSQRQHSAEADYTDIVQAALLQSGHVPVNSQQDWHDIPALAKLGLDPSNPVFDESMQTQLEHARASLMSL